MAESDVDLHGPREDEGRDASDLTNEELTDEFFREVEANTKESTAEFYHTHFPPFLEYAERGDGHLIEDVGGRDIKSFLQREAEEYAPKTVGHRYSAISRFYNVMRNIGLLDDDKILPVERVDRGDVRGMSKKTMSETEDGEQFHYLEPDEVTELIENAPAPEFRNRAFLMLMANTGLRKSEAIRVEVDDVDIEEKKLAVVSPKLTDHENNPERITVYWRSEKLSDTLDSYIQFDRPSYPYADESPYLFPSKQKERLHRTQANRIVKEAAKNAGLQGVQATNASGHSLMKVTSHVLRHSYAMAALENGMSIDEIRDNLHHSDISVTMKYLRRHEEDRRRAVEKHGPQFG